jgi:hypothetical protein
MEKPRKTKRAIGLGVLQLFIGIGAVVGGVGLINDPSGASLGMSLSWLQDTPFTDYSIPGWVLFLINGLVTCVGGILSLLGSKMAGKLAVILGAFLILWIIAQVGWLGLLSALQPLYATLGVVEVILGVQADGRLKGIT